MCLLRINLPNLCPNMNHFDAVDFSECHSEEVVSFFWRSVYIFTSIENIIEKFGQVDLMFGQVVFKINHLTTQEGKPI